MNGNRDLNGQAPGIFGGFKVRIAQCQQVFHNLVVAQTAGLIVGTIPAISVVAIISAL